VGFRADKVQGTTTESHVKPEETATFAETVMPPEGDADAVIELTVGV